VETRRWTVGVLLIAGALSACEDAAKVGAVPAATPVSLEPPGGGPALVLRPVRAHVVPRASQQFTVTGAEGDLAWSVDEGPAGGEVSAGGAYVAPDAPGIFHVIAMSRADRSRRATATVVVSLGGSSLGVTPASVRLRPSTAWTFTAFGSGAAGVSWSVLEGADGGTVDRDGRYTAPTSDGVYHVVAASADGAVKEAAEVTVAGGGVLH
jgi:hypothetical protein